MRPRSPALPSSVVRTSVDAEVAEEIEIEELRRRCARRRTASSATPRARSASASVGKRRQPDAAGDHPGLGRRLDQRERTAERTEAGDALARPRARRPGSVDAPMRLFRSEMPVGAPRRVAQDFEHRERPAQQRIVAARRLDHHELARRRRRGNRRRRQREHVVVGGQRRVRDHFRRDVDGIAAVYCTATFRRQY